MPTGCKQVMETRKANGRKKTTGSSGECGDRDHVKGLICTKIRHDSSQ